MRFIVRRECLQNLLQTIVYMLGSHAIATVMDTHHHPTDYACSIDIDYSTFTKLI